MTSYVTTLDKHYYRVDWKKVPTYSPLTEPEFYKQSGHSKRDIEQLRKSVYPTQGNDYLLLKSHGQLFPVDYKLVPLVHYFWNHEVPTQGWNQPDELNAGFVSLDHYTKKNESTLAFLQGILKGIPVKVFDRREEDLKDLEKANKQVQTLNKKGTLVIELFTNFISISMNDPVLEKLYNHLHIKKNETKLPGGVIVEDGFFKRNKIRKAK